jgi:hypothetical protein
MPAFSRSTQFAIAALLALAMLATRGTHFASVDALPSASWAVFFLAGVFLRPAGFFVALFALASTIDLTLLESGQISDWCLSPAYWALLPAYGALWGTGRLYARRHRDQPGTLLPLGLGLIGGASLAYLCSGGGYYFFSGRTAEPTLAGFAERVPQYLPTSLGTLALYVGLAALAYGALRAVQVRAAVSAAS